MLTVLLRVSFGRLCFLLPSGVLVELSGTISVPKSSSFVCDTGLIMFTNSGVNKMKGAGQEKCRGHRSTSYNKKVHIRLKV